MVAMVGTRKPGHLAQIASDGFRLAAFFGGDAGIGAGEIDEGEYRPVEFFRNLHGAQRLTVALGIGHAEIAAYLFLGSPPFQVADGHHFFTVEARHAASHGEIVAEGAVTVDLRKISKNALDEIHGVGPLRVTREFSLDPRWIRRFGDYLCLLKICCLFAHETFDRLCQRGKSAAWPLNLSILWIIAFPGISTGSRVCAGENVLETEGRGADLHRFASTKEPRGKSCALSARMRPDVCEFQRQMPHEALSSSMEFSRRL